jgi:ubiquinone/menaquinone biosynthesis C-methylase UbiE
LPSFEAQYYEADSFWSNGAITDPQNLKRFQSTVSLIPSDTASILDVGCGNGEFLRVVKGLFPSMHLRGIDRSQTALKYVDAEALQGSVDSIPLPDEVVDCVTCLQVIEHLPCDVYPIALKELARCARKHIIIGVPYAEDLRTEIAQCPQCKCIFNLDLHVRSFDMETVKRLLDEYGFQLTDHLFPCPNQAYLGTNYFRSIKNKVVNRCQTAFVSPVCPLCGYTEGDVTKISNASQTPQLQCSPGIRGLSSRIVRGCVRRFWPKIDLEGYWVVALYTKRCNL